MRMSLVGLVFAAAMAHAGPVTMCGTQFQYDCVALTLGGYTVITTLGSTGQTEITGYSQSSSVVFDQVIPIPPTGAAGNDVQEAVLHADALIALQSGLASSLPACSSTSGNPCIAGNPGGPLMVSSSSTFSYVPVDTSVSQRVDQYSTTLIAILNGSSVFSQTFPVQFSDNSVQAAVLLAGATLTGDGASFSAPFLASSSSNLLGSQLSFVQTGEGPTGNISATVTRTFGPALIEGCAPDTNPLCLDLGSDFVPVPAGQLDINVNTNSEFAIDRNVVTTSTYLTTQTYDIFGTPTSATPEPSSFELAGIFLAVLALAGIRKRFAQMR